MNLLNLIFKISFIFFSHVCFFVCARFLSRLFIKKIVYDEEDFDMKSQEYLV